MWRLLRCYWLSLPLLLTRVLEERTMWNGTLPWIREMGSLGFEKGRFVAMELATMLGGFLEWVGPPRMLLIGPSSLQILHKITSQLFYQHIFLILFDLPYLYAIFIFTCNYYVRGSLFIEKYY